MATRYYIVQWGNHYTAAPGPKVLAWGKSRFGKAHDAEMDAAVAKHHILGSGYAFCVGFDSIRDHKIISPEALASSRRKRMETKLRKKYPLIADILIADELRDNADYYSVESCRKSQAKRQAVIDTLADEFRTDLHPYREVILQSPCSQPATPVHKSQKFVIFPDQGGERPKNYRVSKLQVSPNP
jgi:hypothetical protein